MKWLHHVPKALSVAMDDGRKINDSRCVGGGCEQNQDIEIIGLLIIKSNLDYSYINTVLVRSRFA